MFLFLSGFGVHFSLLKAHGIGWLITKLTKFLKPFLYDWFVLMCCCWLMDRTNLSWRFAADFFTLGLPQNEAWFFKCIVFLYITSFIIYRHCRMRQIVLGLVVGAWIVVTMKFGTGCWWWNTILNFPIGMLVAMNYDRVKSLPCIPVFLLAGLYYLIFYRYLRCSLLASICFSVAAIEFVRMMPIRNKFLSFIGVESLAFYFLEGPAIRYFANWALPNFYLYFFMVMVITCVLVVLFRYLSQMSGCMIRRNGFES